MTHDVLMCTVHRWRLCASPEDKTLRFNGCIDHHTSVVHPQCAHECKCARFCSFWGKCACACACNGQEVATQVRVHAMASDQTYTRTSRPSFTRAIDFSRCPPGTSSDVRKYDVGGGARERGAPGSGLVPMSKGLFGGGVGGAARGAGCGGAAVIRHYVTER